MPDKPQTEARIGRVGEKGRVTLPAEIRTKYGIKEGDVVTFTETRDGILIAPQAIIAQSLLDRLNAALGDIPLEEWIESSHAIRSALSEEMYGNDGTADHPK